MKVSSIGDTKYNKDIADGSMKIIADNIIEEATK